MAARPSIGKRLLSAPASRPTVVFKVFIFHVAETEAAPFLQHQQSLGGGFKDFLFSPLLGEDFQFD